MPPRLGCVIGHGQQFGINRKTAVHAIKRQLARVLKPPAKMIFMRQRFEGVVEAHDIARHHLDIALTQPPLSLKRCRHSPQMADDLLELAKIPPCDAGVFKLEMVEGGVSQQVVQSFCRPIWKLAEPHAF